MSLLTLSHRNGLIRRKSQKVTNNLKDDAENLKKVRTKTQIIEAIKIISYYMKFRLFYFSFPLY